MIVLICGAGCSAKKPIMESENTNTTVKTTKQQSLKDLLENTGSQQCTFTHDLDGTTSSGTVYIANKQMRGDFVSVVNGQNTNSHMIVKDDTIYVWTETMKQGFKFTVDKATEASVNANQKNVDINQKLDYDCGSWTPDASKFALPTDIEFKDFSTMIPSGMNINTSAQGSGSVDMKKMQCATCDQVPTESRAQCKQALGC